MQLNQITSLVFFVLSTLSLASATATDGFLEKKITVRVRTSTDSQISSRLSHQTHAPRRLSCSPLVDAHSPSTR